MDDQSDTGGSSEQLAGQPAAGSAEDRAQGAATSPTLHGQETLPPESTGKASAQPAAGALSRNFGRYRIVRALGRGAMGAVYLAEDTQLGRQVALKTPHFRDNPTDAMLERFYREARAAATLRHPHICPVHDVGQIDGTHYISMAYIEGRPLSVFVHPSVPQSEQQILVVVGKIAQALQDAHEHGIVHRDVKPANIMIDRRGEPVIMDFGLAQQARPEDDVRLTQTGVILGSPAYMSPEQVEADPAKIGPAADQYSLGVILYELLTGEVPFRGSLASVMGQIVTKEPPPPSRLHPGLDPRIDTVCLKMMAKNPADRFASLSDVAQALVAIVRNPSAQSASAKEPPRNPWTRRALASAALAGLLAAVVLYFRVGKTLVEVEISDPGVAVALRGSTITLTGPTSQEIKVEPGDNELTITHGDLKFKTGTFRLEKGNKEVLKVSLAGSTVAAKLGDTQLPLLPLPTAAGSSNRATAKSETKPRSAPAAADAGPAKGKRPAPVAAPVSAAVAAPPILVSPFDSPTAEKARGEWSQYANVPVETTNSVGMKLELVPPGEYLMGPYGGHRTRITRPCYFAACEVTRGQFAQFVAATGFRTLAEGQHGGIRLDNAEIPAKWEPQKKYTWREPGFPQADDHPVVEVAWQDAISFCDWLSRKEGKKYRLPTEAEWEYACRAGTVGRYYNGSEAEAVTQIANVADATAKAVFPRWKDGVKSSDGYVYTSPVGHFRPNSFGLYDMLGNATEWCSNWYSADYYEHAPRDDPQGPAAGEAHVARGGGFTHVAGSRYRYYGNEFFRQPDTGFRIACDVKLPGE